MVQHTSTHSQGELFARVSKDLRKRDLGICCPKCSSTRWSTVDSRKDKNFIRRRKECRKCAHRVTTFESATPHKDAGRALAAALLKVCPYSRHQLRDLDLSDSIWATIVRTLCEELQDHDIDLGPTRAILPRGKHHAK